MKRFVINILLFSAIVCAVLVGLVVACFALVDESAPESIGYELNYKLEYADRICSPKLVIVGGSGCSHGINSEMLEKALGIPVVNTGITGALGLAYQLQTVSAFIRKGDWVVIIPEYPNFTDCLGDGTVLPTICDIRPSDRKLLDVHQWLRLVQYMPKHGLKKLFHWLVFAVKPYEKKMDRNHGGWIYNERGDMVSAWNDSRNLGFPSGLDGRVRTIPKDLGRDCLDRINRFMSEHSDSHILLMPPALQDIAFDRDEKYIQAVQQVLLKNGTPFIAEPRRYRMSNEECWDSIYHLNGKGIKRRTSLLIEDLSSVVGI